MENKLVKALKKLARSTYYQTLYSRAKEMGNINIFNNNIDFSNIQTLFLQYLEIYNSVYRDIAMGENITENVIENDIRLEAYLYCRSKNLKQNNDKKDNNIPISKIPRISFVPLKRGK